MPVSFNSPPRNFFLLGSGGEDAVTNFFHNINRSTLSDNRYTTGDIRYSEVDQKYLLSGNGRDSNSIHFGFVEKQAYDAITDPENPTNVQDWRTKFNQTVTNGTGCRINFMKQQQPYGGLIYVGGKTDGMPWVSQVNSNGTQVWSSTSSTADLEYFDVAIKSNGTASEDQIYACGHKYIALTGEWVAFIEKWDGGGNPLWGKASTRLGGDVNLWSIAANDRDQVVAVGSIDGVEEQGYVVKVDANTGEVIWDLTIDSGEEHQAGSKNPVELKDVYIDDKDHIYIVGAESSYDSGVINNGIIFKYTAEGNLIWQKRSPVGEEHTYYKVWSDTEVEQTIVLSHEVVAGSPTKRGVSLIKYSKNGDVVFKRRIQSSTNFAEGNNVFDEGVIGLEGDPSFYYVLFVDEQENVGTGASKTYNFGKVSASGNGFGEFTYDATNSKTITYSVNSSVDRIGRLSDGSVRNDTSDQISYPYNGLKTLFDDYATNIAYKKTRHEEKDVFLYSGSPSVRPVDFSHVDLTTETTSVTVGGAAQGQQAYTTPGTYTWTAPAGVTSVCVVCVGGGSCNGAALAYRNNITVVPGTGYSVVVGEAGASTSGPGTAYSDGEDSTFSDGTNTTIAEGGSGATQTPATPSGTYDGGGNGGISGEGIGSVGYGGGGAGGYSGNGGNNKGFSPWSSDGAGGGGAGGAWAYWAGGGVGIMGEGANGVATSENGGGGSGGSAGNGEGTSGAGSSTGGEYGGGGSGRWAGNKGGHGAVRIIWGDGRAFPSTLTADQTTSSGPTTTVYAKDKGIVGSSWQLTPDGGAIPVKGPLNREHEWIFTGVNYNGFQTSNVAALGTSDFSFEVWFKTPGQSGGGVWQYFFSNKDNFDGPFTRLGFHVSDGTLRFYTEETGGTKLLVYGNTDCYDDNWHHAVFTRTGGVGTVYLDGDSDGTGPVMSTDIGNATNDWYIGYNGNPTNGNGYFKGSMSDFRYYPRCLSEEEVYQNFHATKYKYKDQLPHTAAKISTNIVTDTTLILHYDFGNRACYEPAENLIPWSTNNGNWNPGSNGTLVKNAGIAPDGTMTATKATISSNDIDTSPSLGPVTSGASTQIAITGGKEYTFSCWVKASTPDQVGNNFKVRWKRITGDSISAETTFALEKNWKRYHCTARTKSNNTTMCCYVGGVDGSEALVWGAQLEEGGNMNNYFQTYGAAKTARDKPKNIVFGGSGLGQPTGCSFTDSANPSALLIGSNFTMPVSVSGSTVTVTHAHNLTTGDSVCISLQLENPSMVLYNNGLTVYYTVTVVDANTFTYDLGSSTHTGYSGRAYYYDPNAGVPCFDFTGNGLNTSFIDTGVNAGSVSSLTVECWMKVDTYSNSGAGITIGDPSGSVTDQCYLGVGTSGGNSIDWRFYVDPYQQECEHFTQTKNWQHCVGTYDQDAGYGTMRLYINDVEQDTAINTTNTSPIDFSSYRNIMVGTNSNQSSVGTGDLDGQIAEVRVYKRRLSVGEISQNFNATRSKYGV